MLKQNIGQKKICCMNRLYGSLLWWDVHYKYYNESLGNIKIVIEKGSMSFHYNELDL